MKINLYYTNNRENIYLIDKRSNNNIISYYLFYIEKKYMNKIHITL